MTTDTFIKGHLAALAHRHGAHLGGIDNMLAVAFTVRNRVRAGWHAGNWMANLYAADEYAAQIYPASVPDLRDITFRMLLQQIDDVYSGLAIDRMTEGALFYAELNHIEREWFTANVLKHLDEHPRVASVGAVTFFK